MAWTLLGGNAMGMEDTGPQAALPDEINGWKALPEDKMQFDRETLYDYIDGGAELYISYDFRRVFSRRYSKDGAPDIVVDVFDMGEPGNAFGVFLHSREVLEQDFGQGSQYTEGLLLFWKGRYYVSVLNSPETDASRETAFDIARRIEASIAEEGEIPAILSRLPRAGLIEESIRYFHHYIWLNSHYYVADENILHIDHSTEAVLAKYDRRGGDTRIEGRPTRSVLLVVRYPDGAAADTAFQDFTRQYLPELPNGGVVRIEDGTWTGCRRDDDLVVVAFNFDSEEGAQRILDDVLVTKE